ncbi:MAG: PFL family protein [Deltaproteobacteria bacterium]|nr:PFL family protein [Deltaproteobacteria bacterium]
MLSSDEIIRTLEMLKSENLDVRTVTLGISLRDCASASAGDVCDRVRRKIHLRAEGLVAACELISRKYGIPIVNKRLAVTPIAAVAEGLDREGYLKVAAALDQAAAEVGVNFLGGYSALVQKGFTRGDRQLIDTLPEVLSRTERVCASVNVASTRAGINMDAVLLMGRAIKEIARRTAERDGFGCAKLTVFANMPEDNPFMAGAYLGYGEPESVINVGVSGPGVVKKELERVMQSGRKLTLGDLSETIKKTSFRVTRVGELIAREVAQALDVPFGIVDLSLAPTPTVGDSVGEILQCLGLDSAGLPGSTAALALLNDAVKKGGAFASSSVGGLSGAFIPVSEDLNLSEAVRRGALSLEKLEAMTAVCSVGLDMVAIPGKVSAETIAAILADEMAIGVVNHKTTAVRLIPVPGKDVGDKAVFGGLFGEAHILEVKNFQGSAKFVSFGGRIPAPITSINN